MANFSGVKISPTNFVTRAKADRSATKNPICRAKLRRHTICANNQPINTASRRFLWNADGFILIVDGGQPLTRLFASECFGSPPLLPSRPKKWLRGRKLRA
jgi:hypothetical protein